MALPVTLSPGDQVYKYTLDKKVGGGTFGEVWLVHDQTIKKDLAVKFLNPSYASVGKLLKEAEVGHRTAHGNLATVHFADVVDVPGAQLVAVVMDYYPRGCVLGEVCPGNFVPVQAAVAHVIDIVRGLDSLHEQGALHNDIKPQNILIGANDEGVLTDYGISAKTTGGASVRPASSYKLHKAPEVIVNDEIDPKSDIYQVGMTALRLINGIGLVRDKWTALGEANFKQRVVDGKLIAPSDFQPFVPNRLRRIVQKAIQTDPDQRYGSALDMRRDLERLALQGSWVQDAAGEYSGEDCNCHYRFAVEPMRGGKFKFTAYKRYKASGHETRLTKYCGTQLGAKDVEKAKKKFMSAVVEGSL